jgi:hypothetical protein
MNTPSAETASTDNAATEQPEHTTATIVTSETYRGHCADNGPELTILMPCLNEAETIETCIRKARSFLDDHQVNGEILIADNGSTDRSVAIAERCGARVVHVPHKGYGHALQAGSRAAAGRYVIMGDADDSYDFSQLSPFLEQLRAGKELVMGTRLRGKIMPGAMPPLHRWLGNPVLTGLGRLFFGIEMTDFHSGLRGYSKAAFEKMDLRTTGMEFASEMVIRSRMVGLSMAEVPITLYPDGRSRPPHLRSWRDGWRHLQFMLCYSPRWLFLYPGMALFLVGVIGMIALAGGARVIGGVNLNTNTLAVAGLAAVVGFQLVAFALMSARSAIAQGMMPESQNPLPMFRRHVSLETGCLGGAIIAAIGLGAIGWVFAAWAANGFGDLDPVSSTRSVVFGVVLAAIGVQTVFSSFLLSIVGGRR